VVALLALAGFAFTEPMVAWQLGQCTDHGRVRIGGAVPEEACKAAREAMKRAGAERVVCARILISE
jgi:hypothetical protein